MKNGCQLITYPDSLGKNLKELTRVLDTFCKDLFTGIHILPFYPSSADRGFAPVTYRSVDPAFGTWDDIRGIALTYDLVIDFMFNHISGSSKYFTDFLQNKERSPYKDMFIRFKDFWPGGSPSEENLRKIYTRKARPPYLEIEFADGTKENIWCTFDYEQIDLNLRSKRTMDFVRETLTFLCEAGARIIRLDAFAYAAKRPGTSCFFLEPEVWDLLEQARGAVDPFDAILLPEIHEHHSVQLKLAEKGYWVYDFALPMLILQALYEGCTKNLKHWLRICPRNQITTLDTHDGIGVVDIVDLMDPEEIERTKENLYIHGANVKRIYSSDRYDNLDIYQLNCTYYSALGNNDAAYLLARAIQFFTPGIPQIYYVGLLAGRNDIELLEKTKMGRNINRHYYTFDEIKDEVERPVVRRLFELIRFRNSCEAFNGEMTLESAPEHELIITWKNGENYATLKADVEGKTFSIEADGEVIILPGTDPVSILKKKG